MTPSDWIKLAEGMDEAELTRFKNAINTLAEWPTFNKEFKWTGIFSLGAILKHEGIRRTISSLDDIKEVMVR
jgi:hypothetical protein